MTTTLAVSRRDQSRQALYRSMILTTILAIVLTLLTSVGAFAANKDASDQADQALRTTVSKEVQGNKYALEGGGTVNGSDLIDTEGNVNEAMFGRLTGDARTKFAGDLRARTEVYTNPQARGYDDSLSKSDGVTKETASNWISQLKNTSGMATAWTNAINSSYNPVDLENGRNAIFPLLAGISTGSGALVYFVMALVSFLWVWNLAILLVLSGFIGSGGKVGTAVSKVGYFATRAFEKGNQNSKNPLLILVKEMGITTFVVIFIVTGVTSGMFSKFFAWAIDVITSIGQGIG